MNLGGSSRGHTQRYLQRLLSEQGLAPRSSLGQCFLTDLNLLDILVDAARLGRDDLVLEVGAGTGSLTQRLAARAGAVVSVEIDRGLYSLAADAVRNCPNVRILQADILERKNALNAEVFEAVDSLVSPLKPLHHKVVSNLPYVIATPVISLLLLDNRPWALMVVTIQKELADRLIARPGTKEYGSLSVLAQSLAQVELLRELPPSAFWPKPKVSSAFVRIEPSPQKRAAVKDLPTLALVTRGVMLHRRKVLRSALGSLFTSVTKQDIDAFLTGIGLDLRTRAESLAPEQFVDLANRCPSHWLEN
jgi:16S rRNA (adenine1518-N6/adenine1519-N6)-dimethyltransferase